jgi:hypothetical protein
MYTDEELKNIILDAIASHSSLDHKLHLMESVEKAFERLKNVEELKKDNRNLNKEIGGYSGRLITLTEEMKLLINSMLGM